MKREEILWECTPEDCGSLLENQLRETLFRKGTLHFLGIEPRGSDGTSPGRCTEEEEARCEFGFGEYKHWACENCERKMTHA